MNTFRASFLALIFSLATHDGYSAKFWRGGSYWYSSGVYETELLLWDRLYEIEDQGFSRVEVSEHYRLPLSTGRKSFTLPSYVEEGLRGKDITNVPPRVVRVGY